MTEDKEPVQPTALGAREDGTPPDESRRRLAKAALVSPVIMTLAPRQLLAAPLPGCADSGGALLISLNATGGSYVCTVTDENTNDSKVVLNVTRPGGTLYQCELKKDDIPTNCH